MSLECFCGPVIQKIYMRNFTCIMYLHTFFFKQIAPIIKETLSYQLPTSKGVGFLPKLCSNYSGCNPEKWATLPKSNSNSTWKCMVAKSIFLLGMSIFRVELLVAGRLRPPSIRILSEINPACRKSKLTCTRSDSKSWIQQVGECWKLSGKVHTLVTFHYTIVGN